MDGIAHQLGEDGARNQVGRGIPIPCISFCFSIYSFFKCFRGALEDEREHTVGSKGTAHKFPGAQQVVQLISFSYTIQRLALTLVLVFVFLPSHVKLLVSSVEETQRTLTHFYLGFPS